MAQKPKSELKLKGDAKGRQNLLDFVKGLTEPGHLAKSDTIARANVQHQMRSIRGRVENALPHIEAWAATRERERIIAALVSKTNADTTVHASTIVGWLQDGGKVEEL